MTKELYPVARTDVPSTPATPASGYSRLYRKTDGDWYTLDDAGNEKFVFENANVYVVHQRTPINNPAATELSVFDVTTPSIAAGDYVVEIRYHYSIGNNRDDFRARFYWNGVSQTDYSLASWCHSVQVDDANDVRATGYDFRFNGVTAGTQTMKLVTGGAVVDKTAWDVVAILRRVG